MASIRYRFLVEMYETERLKVLSTWATFHDEDLPFRLHPTDRRGRSVHEQMVHQCLSEDIWFRTNLGIDVDAPPLPEDETRLAFIRRYATDSAARLAALAEQDDAWWEALVDFFEVRRSRAWVMARRIAHTAHHRGQQTAMLRMLNRDVYSTYGPTADTGGLMKDHAPTVYPYRDVDRLIAGEEKGGMKAGLPAAVERAVTERS